MVEHELLLERELTAAAASHTQYAQFGGAEPLTLLSISALHKPIHAQWQAIHTCLRVRYSIVSPSLPAPTSPHLRPLDRDQGKTHTHAVTLCFE